MSSHQIELTDELKDELDAIRCRLPRRTGLKKYDEYLPSTREELFDLIEELEAALRQWQVKTGTTLGE